MHGGPAGTLRASLMEQRSTLMGGEQGLPLCEPGRRGGWAKEKSRGGFVSVRRCPGVSVGVVLLEGLRVRHWSVTPGVLAGPP